MARFTRKLPDDFAKKRVRVQLILFRVLSVFICSAPRGEAQSLVMLLHIMKMVSTVSPLIPSMRFICRATGPASKTQVTLASFSREVRVHCTADTPEFRQKWARTGCATKIHKPCDIQKKRQGTLNHDKGWKPAPSPCCLSTYFLQWIGRLEPFPASVLGTNGEQTVTFTGQDLSELIG